MARLHVRHAATLLALLGVGLAMGAPFILGAHAVLARLRSVSLQIFAMLAASAVFSAAANAGKLHLMQTALGLKLRFARTLTLPAPGSRLPARNSISIREADLAHQAAVSRGFLIRTESRARPG
ncbi:MAG: hypothetical protein ABSD12_13890 [Paraburkholderia sp.]|jgi:hypothetical protein